MFVGKLEELVLENMKVSVHIIVCMLLSVSNNSESLKGPWNRGHVAQHATTIIAACSVSLRCCYSYSELLRMSMVAQACKFSCLFRTSTSGDFPCQ